MKALLLIAAGGAHIAARVYEPSAPLEAAVVIGPAMGVKQDYYAPSAQWLAANGYLAVTFDYRGMGDSRPASARRTLRGFDADLYDWARDFDAAIEAATAAAPNVPLYVVGHSLGAQLPGMPAQRDRIAGLISVAAGSGYFWHVLVPLATGLFGYFPGAALGKVGDLPRGVVLQWRRWCMHPRYHVGAEGETLRQAFAAARFRVVALTRLPGFAARPLQAAQPPCREQFRATLWMRVTSLLHGLKESPT